MLILEVQEAFVTQASRIGGRREQVQTKKSKPIRYVRLLASPSHILKYITI